MEGFFGDVLKTVIAVMLALFLLVLLIFFYRMQSISHYQHAVNGILQQDTRTLSTNDQFADSNDKTSHRLYQLDSEYRWMFVFVPENTANVQRYSYGDPIKYKIKVNIPLLNVYSPNDYDHATGDFDSSKDHKPIYHTYINGQTTCEQSADDD